MTSPTSHETELDLPPEPSSVPAGRHFLTTLLDAWGLHALDDTAQLLLSELITNAIKHAHSPVHVTVVVADRLTVTVTDYRPDRLPVPLDDIRETGDANAEGGRGLALVAMLSDDWGVHRDGDHKSIWFSLPTAA